MSRSPKPISSSPIEQRSDFRIDRAIVSAAGFVSWHAALVALVKLAARMDVANHSTAIHYKGDGGKGAVALQPPTLQRAPIAIQSHGKDELCLFGCFFECRHAPIAGRFGMVDAEHHEPTRAIFGLQLAQRRRRRLTKWTTLRPPAKEHYLAAQICHVERPGVQPMA